MTVFSSGLFKFINFADDTTLFTTLNNHDNINETINEELSKFNNWLKANKLSLNVNKTKVMAFHMAFHLDISGIQLEISSIQLEIYANRGQLEISLIQLQISTIQHQLF